MNKKYISVLLIAFFPCLLYAQGMRSTDSSKYKALLFERFIEGHVLLKSGDVEQVPLNYNTDDQSIYFLKDGEYMILTGLESVDTIYLQNKKFVPFKDNVYEVLADPSSSAVIYVTYTNRTRPLVATTDHNGTTKQEASGVSNTVTNVYARGVPRPKSIEIEKHYWIEKNKKMYRADNAKQVSKLFSSRSKEVEKFIEENNINFIVDTDMLKLAAFCRKLN